MNAIKNIIKTVLAVCTAAGIASCNDFLDVSPDSRTEVVPGNVAKLLVSAYPESLPNLMLELMSDNIADLGTQYTFPYSLFQEAYNFSEITYLGQDSPYSVWETCYGAIQTANTALQAIGEYGDEYDLSAEKGEALLCRAYAHFILSNAFCQAYNSETSSTDLGIAYIKDMVDDVKVNRPRGTVAETYKMIGEDIEEGLPLIDDRNYAQQKYHFNMRSAYSFAAQFYLYYGKYREAIDAANVALGEDPTALYRDYSSWAKLTTAKEYTISWVNSLQAANFLIMGGTSIAGRVYSSRYGIATTTESETLLSSGPWNTYNYETLIFTDSNHMYVGVSGQSIFFPKQIEYFVYTDPVQGIGYPYIATVPFSAEKTLLNRAEAYALLGEYESAVKDLNYFYLGSQIKTPLTLEQIHTYYSNYAYNKELSPRGIDLSGDIKVFVNACLHARRLLTFHEGGRTLDLKRYGIAYTHTVDTNTLPYDIEIEPYDKRLAIQIPEWAIAAGVTPNPR